MSNISINTNLKVAAGPGAGKTTFLINHIKKVVRQSPELKRSRKIACITYTNAAADTILDRLDLSSDSVEVSTIHSFLYTNVITPYWDLVPDELGIDIKNVDGHDEMPITGGLLYEWKRNTSQTYLDDDNKIIRALNNLTWQFNERDELVLEPLKTYLGNIGKYWIRKESYFEYKKLYWGKGQLAHEDVLYLAYKLLDENPSILRFLKAKFPFIFIDEFQDTSPLQYKILMKLSSFGIKTGVIGDWGQTIYKFQGANPELFQSISMRDMQEITLESNYRSSKDIVAVLNKLRSDISQICKSDAKSGHLKVFVGDKHEAIAVVEELIGKSPCVLTRRNREANLINNKYASDGISKYNTTENINVDTNSLRRLSIRRSINSIIHANNGYFKDSISEIEKVIGSSISSDLEKKKHALKILKYLLSNYRELAELSLTNFLNEIRELCPSRKITGLASGRVKKYYDQYKVKDVVVEIERSEPNKFAQTIHQSKGLEYKSVLLLLGIDENTEEEFDEQKELGFLLKPDLENDEEHRVRYVAISRAITDLFISVPSLSSESRKRLMALGFEIN